VPENVEYKISFIIQGCKAKFSNRSLQNAQMIIIVICYFYRLIVFIRNKCLSDFTTGCGTCSFYLIDSFGMSEEFSSLHEDFFIICFSQELALKHMKFIYNVDYTLISPLGLISPRFGLW